LGAAGIPGAACGGRAVGGADSGKHPRMTNMSWHFAAAAAAARRARRRKPERLLCCSCIDAVHIRGVLLEQPGCWREDAGGRTLQRWQQWLFRRRQAAVYWSYLLGRTEKGCRHMEPRLELSVQ
jgi:hypothetical protein